MYMGVHYVNMVNMCMPMVLKPLRKITIGVTEAIILQKGSKVMTLEQLAEIIDRLKSGYRWDEHKEKRVAVRTNDPSIGPVAMSTVVSAGVGFDWERNVFLIHCEDKLTKKPEPTKMCRHCELRGVETKATHNSRGYDLCEMCYKTRLAAEIESEKQQEEFYRRNT
jgi:superfamily II helicase